MKKIAWLMALALTLGLAVPAEAALNYGVIYDDTEILSCEGLDELGEVRMPRFTEEYGIDLRVDILDGYGDFSSAEELAHHIYANYDYGSGDNLDGLTLTLVTPRDDTGVELVDWYIYAQGGDEDLNEMAQKFFLNELGIQDLADPELWEGSLDVDEDICVDICDMFLTGAEIFADSIGWQGTDAVPAGEDGETAEDTEDGWAEEGESAASAGVYVRDLADLITDEEEAELEEMARSASETYECGIYLLTVDDYLDYGSYDEIYDAAKDVYRDEDMGWGEEKSGIFLMMSMNERDMALIAYGYGNTAFTDYGKDWLKGEFKDDFREDDWYYGFRDYIYSAEEMLIMARNDSPMDVDNEYEDYYTEWDTTYPPVGTMPRNVAIFICVVIGFVVAFIVRAVLRAKMKSVAMKTEADTYVTDGGVVLTDKQDIYTHTTESRVYNPPSSSSSDSGGTSVDSDGFSGGSDKF